jgi:hypothetical protein
VFPSGAHYPNFIYQSLLGYLTQSNTEAKDNRTLKDHHGHTTWCLGLVGFVVYGFGRTGVVFVRKVAANGETSGEVKLNSPS